MPDTLHKNVHGNVHENVHEKMNKTSLAHSLFTQFVCPELANTIEGDLLEESRGNRLVFSRDVITTAGALFVHQLRQTSLPVFVLCIICLLLLKMLEMSGIFLMLFVFGLNTLPLTSILSMCGVALIASYTAVVACLRWVPGFGRPQVAVTAFLLLIYALVNIVLMMTLGRETGRTVLGTAVNLMIFETLFHILPIVFAGYRHGRDIEAGANCPAGNYSGN